MGRDTRKKRAAKKRAAKMRFGARGKKTLGQLRDEGDVWCCPVCHRDNVHSIGYVASVLNPRGVEALLKGARVESLDDLPVATGSAFETVCGACRVNVAPRRIDGGFLNPILHPAYTHGED